LLKNLGADLPEIVADKSQIYQVLINLVVNAIQAMPAGGSLIISTAVHVKSVSLAVKDTGMGIKEELLEKVFIPFFTTKDVNEGTGLGLAVVHGIVAAHGGTVKVESKVGKGTTFTVILPLDHQAETILSQEGEGAKE
jgi:signal transduction histidine kinase